jgi:hypothetical protein
MVTATYPVTVGGADGTDTAGVIYDYTDHYTLRQVSGHWKVFEFSRLGIPRPADGGTQSGWAASVTVAEDGAISCGPFVDINLYQTGAWDPAGRRFAFACLFSRCPVGIVDV